MRVPIERSAAREDCNRGTQQQEPKGKVDCAQTRADGAFTLRAPEGALTRRSPRLREADKVQLTSDSRNGNGENLRRTKLGVRRIPIG